METSADVEENVLFTSFVLGQAVRRMRDRGMTDTEIACIIQDIRHATLQSERLRMKWVYDANSPTNYWHGAIEDKLKKYWPREG